MKHEYLHELFPNGNLPFPYNEEDYYDFDKRDTYNMDNTLVMWLYERLRFFQEKVSKEINMGEKLYLFGKEVLIDGRVVTMQECVDRMVEDCKLIILAIKRLPEDWTVAEAAKDDLFKVLSKVFWAMWW